MKPVVTRLKTDPRTIIVGFDASEDGLPRPHLFAQKFVQDQGYEIEPRPPRDRGIYDFMAFRGDPEEDESPDVRLFKVQIVGRFYVTVKGKVGAMSARRQLTKDQRDMDVEFIYTTWDGRCALTLDEIVGICRDEVLELSEKVDEQHLLETSSG